MSPAPPVVAGGTVPAPEPVSVVVGGGGGASLDEPEESDELGVSDWNELEPGLSKSTANGAVRSVPVPGTVPMEGNGGECCGTIARLSTPSLRSADPSTWNVIVDWSADSRPTKWK